MKNQSLIFIAMFCLAFVFTAAAQNKSDELKQRVLAQAQSASPDDYAFTRTVHTDSTSNGKAEKHVNVEKFDPTKPAEERWTLVSVDDAPPSADDLKSFRTESGKRRVPGYYRFAGYFGTPATTSTDSRGRTVFRFTALPKDTLMVINSDVSQNATVDASINEANGASFVEQVHVTLKPMRIKLIAKIEAYESSSRYRIGPEGKPILMEQTSDLTGSGMGQKGQAHTVITYSDYRAAGNQR